MVVTNGTQWSSSYRRIPLHGARENNPVKMNGPFFFGQQKIEVHYGKKNTKGGGGEKTVEKMLKTMQTSTWVIRVVSIRIFEWEFQPFS